MLPYGIKQRVMLDEVVGYPTVLSNESYKFFYSGDRPEWAYNMRCRRIHGHNFCRGK